MWLREQSAFCCQALEDLFICVDGCLNNFDDCVEKKDLTLGCAFFH
jgi:hypothetical protein